MSKKSSEILEAAEQHLKQNSNLIGKLFTTAQPNAIYGKPVISGEYTVISASEAFVAMGTAYGVGSGTEPDKSLAGSESESQDQSDQANEFSGGAGGGGGGVSVGRPVAVVSVGPDGVQVDPVVDATKIALAFLTMFGSMLIMLGKMWRASRG
jgi:uncharacterized spore protein YtfJ